MCFKLNGQVTVSDDMMPFTTESNLEDSTMAPEVNTVLMNVDDQKMPFKVIVETGEENKNQFSNEGQSLPEKASDKKLMLHPKKE